MLQVKTDGLKVSFRGSQLWVSQSVGYGKEQDQDDETKLATW